MTSRINLLLPMLLAVTAAIALSAPGVASARSALSTPAHGSAPNIIPIPGDPPPIPPAPPALKRALVITVALKVGDLTPTSFPDKTEAEVGGYITGTLNPWLTKVSRGRFNGYSIGPTHQYVVVQSHGSMCTDAWLNDLEFQAKVAERRAGTEPDNYDAVVYYFTRIPECNWDGIADFPEDGHSIALNGNTSLLTLAHEFGHNLGLGHAGTQYCKDGSGQPVPLSGPLEDRCTQVEYGNPYSAMGADLILGETPRSYSAPELNKLGWNVGTKTVSAGDPTSTTILTQLDVNLPGSTQALRLVDGVRTLWVEFRKNPHKVNGTALLVSVEEPSLAEDGRHVAPFLLDMTPLDGDRDRPLGARTSQELPVGHAWTNPLGTMTITLNSVDGVNASVTVQSVPGPPPAPGPGPGPATVLVPNVMGQTILSATHQITAAGLVMGTVNSTIDCEAIGKVVAQSPVGGVNLPPGSRVDLTKGIQRPGGCGIAQ